VNYQGIFFFIIIGLLLRIYLFIYLFFYLQIQTKAEYNKAVRNATRLSMAREEMQGWWWEEHLPQCVLC